MFCILVRSRLLLISWESKQALFSDVTVCDKILYIETFVNT